VGEFLKLFNVSTTLGFLASRRRKNEERLRMNVSQSYSFALRVPSLICPRNSGQV